MKRISANVRRRLGQFVKRVVTFSVCVTMSLAASAQDYSAYQGPQFGSPWQQSAYPQQAAAPGFFGPGQFAVPANQPFYGPAGYPAHPYDALQAQYAQPTAFPGGEVQQVAFPGGFVPTPVPNPAMMPGGPAMMPNGGLLQNAIPAHFRSTSQALQPDGQAVNPDGVGGETSAAFQDIERNYYFWLRHIEGRQVGDVSPFTSAGGTYYNWIDAGLLMFNGQFILTNNAQVAANLGLVGRTYWNDAVVGAGMWIDFSQSRNNNTYTQLGFSLEYLTCGWSGRFNAYIELFDTLRVLNQTQIGNPGNAAVAYLGNNLITGGQLYQTQEYSMGGVDLEIARHLDFLRLPTLEAFGGFYTLGGNGTTATGGKFGLRGYVFPDLAGEVTIASDDTFGTNVFGGVTWFFGGRGGDSPCGAGNTCGDKLTIPVIRNEQIAVREERRLLINDLVIQTKNGIPIRVVHVDSNDAGAGAMTGTFESPLTSLNNVQANSQPGDIVLVHAGTTYTNQQVVLQNDQQFLGEGRITLNGVTQPAVPACIQICTDAGFIDIPETAAGSSLLAAPVIRNNQNVNVITLASIGNTNNTVAGFTIDGLGGPGTAIADPGGPVTDSTFRSLAIRGFGGNGISLANGVGGTNLFTKLDFDDINGDDILLNMAGVGSMTTISDTTMNGSGGAGLHVSNAAAGATISAVTGPVLGVGLDIGLAANGGAFTGGGAAVQLDNNNIASMINLLDLDIRTDGAKGIQGNNIGTVVVNTPATTNDLIAMNSGAIDVTGGAIGAGGWTFDVLSATNTGAMAGVNMSDLSGFGNTFLVTGRTTVDTTGGAGIAGINLANSNATYTFMGGVDIDNTTGHGIAASNVEQLNIPDAGASNTINSAGNDAINLVNTNATLADLDINSPTNNGIDASVTSGVDRTVMVTGVDIDAAGAQGILLANSGAGDLRFNLASGSGVDPNLINSVGTAIEGDVTGTGNMIVNITGNHTLGSTNGAGIDLDGSVGAGTLFVEDLGGTTIIGGNTTTGGALFNEVVFDATAGGTVQQVVADRLEIGTLASRVNGDGFSGTNVRGNLRITDLDIANADGTGLIVKNGAGFPFTISTTALSSIDTLRGTAINIDPVAADLNFNTVTSIDSSANGAAAGITLDGVTAADGTLDGNVLFIASTTIRNATGANANGVEIMNGVGTHTFNTVDIETTAGNGMFFSNLISSGTVPGGVFNDGVIVGGGTIRSTQNAGIRAIDVRSIAVDGVDITSADIAVDLEVNSSVMTALIQNNGLNTGAPGVFSLQAVVNGVGTMCLGAQGNDDGAGGTPVGQFRLNNTNANSVLGITQASTAALGAANNGVVVSDNGTITFNCDLNNP